MMIRGYKRTAVVALLLAIGCGGQTEETSVPEKVYVFTDDAAPRERVDYAIRGEECFVQIAEFPGYRSRRWFHCLKLPDGLRKETMDRLGMPGEVSPPFEPGGVYYSRVLIEGTPSNERERAFFRDDNPKIRSWADQLRDAVVREDFKVAELPSWISSNPIVKRQLGLSEEE